MTLIFIPREASGEPRVAATPETVKKLVQNGFEVHIEPGAGAGSYITDADYEASGAKAQNSLSNADVIAKLHPPTEQEVSSMKEGALVLSFLWPYGNRSLVESLASRKVTSYAMDLIPRITRAQKMDALSSQSNIAGYKAVVMAADHSPKLFPLLMTAAGTIRPAKVVILGAGVAGLQAIATARRLGAIVEVSDIRPAVKEQVQSLGAKFIEVETEENLETEGGYAKEVSADFLKKQQAVVREHIVGADVVITTALVPGKQAPRLISDDMVRDMKEGAVIVDLAAEQGGNCSLTEMDKVVTKEGVTIIGKCNIAATLPVHASDMYAKNILNAFSDIGSEGAINLDFEDEVVLGAVVTHGGEIRNEKVLEAYKGGKA
ncbi:MAG: Re/Si-specific NAD(P)(+) transhydrogenase subunit alpha [Candidatus Eisenbacteria bacterium]|uniref:NAD(P) transhydrogenase subunit alpha part 1 n=1 Tax=Eiseniibacteriota bacterium TaxID=2212470 RepID=A0A7Y2EBS4_UNCEI|nr:Re/Si-specific NAD(P)(+) transhydrogenase subunit alpha [Candidatus Eisenbacteria bacterium]